MTGSTSGRGFLRPPTTVARKSQSFNAADRNKIHDATKAPTQTPVTEQSRSRSVNAKHSFTIQTPQSTKSQTRALPPRTLKQNQSKLIAPSVKSSKFTKTNDIRNGSVASESRFAKPPTPRDSKLATAKAKSGLIPPKTSVSRSASNSSKGSTITRKSPDPVSEKQKTFSKTSVLSRFRKKTDSPAISSKKTEVTKQTKQSTARATSDSKGKRTLIPPASYKTHPRAKSSHVYQRNVGAKTDKQRDPPKHSVTIDGNEIVISVDHDATNKTEPQYKRDRIDVQNLNLLVRPYQVKSSDAVVTIDDVLSSDSDDVTKSSDSSLGLFQKSTKFPTQLDATETTVGRDVKLPQNLDRKTPKTATVAPFCREPPGKEENKKETREEKKKEAKDIANLRQNLEETMVNLRNSQLKNRLSDEFERRISAQLEHEVDEIALPEVPPPLDSNSTFRSNFSSLKLNTGDRLGQTAQPSGGYGSTSRPSKAAWTVDSASVCSDDISDLITGISSDEVSTASTNNSPFHVASGSTKSDTIRSDYDEKSKKKYEKTDLGKPRGSSAVGCRLAGADRSESPSGVTNGFMYRNAHTYRSLPRMKKYSYGPDLAGDSVPSNGATQQNQGFVRSPALKLLLRSKANKKSKSHLNESSQSTGCDRTVQSNLRTVDTPMTNSTKTDLLSMSATQSLPRRLTRRTGSTTWSQTRCSPNAAYSLPATPDNNNSLFDQFGNYIDDANISNITFPGLDNSFQYRHKPFDWQPLSIASSSPNVNRTTDSYRSMSPQNDLRRRGSSLSLGAAQHQARDENSIATARYFIQSLSRSNNFHQHDMVQELEQSLSYLTSRLRELAANADEKDSELEMLRAQIDNLKQASNDDEFPREKSSVASLSSLGSQASIASSDEKQKKKKGWFVFGRSKSKSNLVEPPTSDTETVQQLRAKLRLKEQKLTDIRLEALTSRHQLQHLHDVMNQMKNEMENLRKENEKLHQMGLSAYSMTSQTNGDMVGENRAKVEERKCKIYVKVNDYSSKNVIKSQLIDINISPLSRTASWNELDDKVSSIFMNYCQTIDPTYCLKLDETSIESYSIGEGVRVIGADFPALLPCGYLVGDVDSVVINLQDARHSAVDSLSFELLIDKTILKYYSDTLLQRRRMVVCGPKGSGKTLLSNRLAEYAASLSESPDPVLYLDANQKALPEMEEFLNNIASQCNNTRVVVIDNLQSVRQPSILLQEFLKPEALERLFLICATNESRSDLDEFAWITSTNRTPPVRNYLSRKLRRSFLEHQMKEKVSDDVLSSVVTWLPKCWQHVNDCLQNLGGPEMGPRMFSTCPMDGPSARVWFTDLWNYTVVPYVISVASKSTQERWSDPTDWVYETMPWKERQPALERIKADDIVTPHPSSADPLYNMLMKLQEAAKYDENHEDHYEVSIEKALTELGPL